jgi:hypothetical protein
LYSVINPVILSLFSVSALGIIALLYTINKLIYTKNNLFALIFIAWIAIQLVIVISIDTDYNAIRKDYSAHYNQLRENDVDEVNATWSIVEKLNHNYINTYGQNKSSTPSRKIFSNTAGSTYLLANPILTWYFFNINAPEQPDNGYYKLTIVQNSGACGEFASSVKLLVHDVTGFDTRVIVMEGKDHAFPEVNVENKWWVFDKLFTTSLQAIESSKYADHLMESGTFKSVHDLHEINNDRSLLEEHGFNSSNLTIIAIYDFAVQESDDKPADNINIEIFAIDNSYDPLVNKGVTDSNGIYSTELRSEKEYVVFAQKQQFPKSSSIGFEKVYLNQSTNSTIMVHLHKYQ